MESMCAEGMDGLFCCGKDGVVSGRRGHVVAFCIVACLQGIFPAGFRAFAGHPINGRKVDRKFSDLLNLN